MGWIRKKDMGEEKQKQNSSNSKERSGSKRKASAASGGPGDPKKPSRFASLPGISGAQLQNLNPFKSVGVKLFLIFFVAIAAIVLTLGLTSYSKAKSTIKNNTALANSQTIQQTQEKLDIILKQYEDMAMQMFFDPEMQSVIDELARNRQDEYQNFVLTDQINKKLSNQLNSNSSIKAIYLVPPEESQRIISSGSGGLDINTIREADWFKNAKKTNQTSWVPSSKGKDGSVSFELVRSLQSLSRGGAYVIIVELKTDVIENQLNGISLGDGSKLQVGDANGLVVASTVNSEAGTKSTFSFMKDQKEPANTLETEDSGGREILAVYNTLETTGWKLVGTVPVEMLVKDAKGILVLTMGLAVGAIVVAILIGFWMARMIATPLSKLKDLMLEGAKGNLNVRTQHKSKDEIGQLGQAFNLMVDQITKLVQQTNTTAQLVLETAGELTDASKKTAISAKEIAIATEEIANGASSLATEAERGNEMTEHMAKQMGLVITANEEMGSAARHVEQSSQYGTKQLNELLDKTHQTEEMTRELMHKVDALKQTASSVNKVLVVLQNITKQTNILSLNATIEAARAGAAGRGFMVVADEIRQLADQSRQSIDMVGQITGQIMSEMNETVEALSDAYPLFQHQMNAVKETNEIFVSVQEQMGDFTQRLQSVTESISALHDSHSVLSEGMSNVSAVAEESSATSEEVASLSNEQQSVGDHLVELSAKLENVSIQLKESLSRFTLN